MYVNCIGVRSYIRCEIFEILKLLDAIENLKIN